MFCIFWEEIRTHKKEREMPFGFFKKKRKGDESKDGESSEQSKDVPTPNPSRASGHNKSATETTLTDKLESKKPSKKHSRNTSLTSSNGKSGTNDEAPIAGTSNGYNNTNTAVTTTATTNTSATTSATTTTKGRFVVTRPTATAPSNHNNGNPK
ncbi:hypothetical protein RFI_03635, partial [Reticulomyxa filosa]